MKRLFTYLLLLALFTPLITNAAIFGWEFKSNSGNAGLKDLIVGTAFTAPRSGKVTKLSAQINVTGGRPATVMSVKGAIYDMTVSSTPALVGTSTEVCWDNISPSSCNAIGSNRFWDIPVTNPVYVNASTSYLLVLWGNITGSLLGSPILNFVFKTDTAYNAQVQSLAYGTFPNPMVPTQLDSQEYSIYVTYTTTPQVLIGNNGKVVIGNKGKVIIKHQ